MPSPLLAWRQLPFPAAWDEEFGAAGPLLLEVGFGDGRFTERLARERAEARVVGLEVSSGSLQRALRRLKRAGLGNVRLAKVGAQFALRQLFAAASLEAVNVNFPDPWPKERHVGRRLLQRSFFELAAARLQPGGEIRFATDHPDYLDFALREAAASGLYDALSPTPPAAVFETKYALKWRAQGIALNYVVFRRNDAAAPVAAHLERPKTMPHALFTGSLPDEAALEKVVIEYQGGHVILHDAAKVMGSARPAWLIRASVDEDDLKQQLLVLVAEREPGEVIVRLEPFGDPIITPVARGAVHAASQWLEAHTALTAKARNY